MGGPDLGVLIGVQGITSREDVREARAIAARIGASSCRADCHCSELRGSGAPAPRRASAGPAGRPPSRQQGRQRAGWRDLAACSSAAPRSPRRAAPHMSGRASRPRRRFSGPWRSPLFRRASARSTLRRWTLIPNCSPAIRARSAEEMPGSLTCLARSASTTRSLSLWARRGPGRSGTRPGRPSAANALALA